MISVLAHEVCAEMLMLIRATRRQWPASDTRTAARTEAWLLDRMERLWWRCDEAQQARMNQQALGRLRRYGAAG